MLHLHIFLLKRAEFEGLSVNTKNKLHNI